jgi:hypothetical protein
MQSKGAVLLFLAIFALPLIAVSTNHNLFFVLVSIAVVVLSLKDIYSLLTVNNFPDQQLDEELEEELEDLVDIDLKRFGTGISVVYNMIVVLFLVYCAFYLITHYLKILASFAILLQVHFIIKKLKDKEQSFDKNLHKPQILLSSISNIAVVVFAVLNKILKVI